MACKIFRAATVNHVLIFHSPCEMYDSVAETNGVGRSLAVIVGILGFLLLLELHD